MEARGASEGERKTITALFADIKGSMALMEDLDPEEARTIRDCICPPPRDESRSLDTRRIGQNALISALAQGGCFGLAFSLNNYLRINARPLIKQLSGFFSPIVGGFSTSVRNCSW